MTCSAPARGGQSPRTVASIHLRTALPGWIRFLKSFDNLHCVAVCLDFLQGISDLDEFMKTPSDGIAGHMVQGSHCAEVVNGLLDHSTPHTFCLLNCPQRSRFNYYTPKTVSAFHWPLTYAPSAVLRSIRRVLRRSASFTKARSGARGTLKNCQKNWSGRPDLNRRPQRPERCALTSCATPRRDLIIAERR
jgi:hypothetical protein